MDGIARHPAHTDPTCPTNQLRLFFGMPDIRASFAHPDRVAEVILKASSIGDLPLRLPLGGDDWEAIKSKVDDMQKDLERVRELSLSAGNSD
jgi:hypothetical protein